MDYLQLASLYCGRPLTLKDVGFIDHSDGNGVQINFWNITDKPQPTIAELEALQPQVEAQENKDRILAQIIELDSKLPRAITESMLGLDSRIKDPLTGQTWLEYYNQEITQHRTQLL